MSLPPPGIFVQRHSDNHYKVDLINHGASVDAIVVYASAIMPPTFDHDEPSATPPDGGYGWICVVALFLVNFSTWGAVAVSRDIADLKPKNFTNA